MVDKKQVPILCCKVVGVTFEGRQGVLRQLLKGKDMQEILVHLVPEPDNVYDSNAVKVVAASTREQIGYVPREAAEDVLLSLGLGMVHERQKCTIGCTAKKNGGFVYWASLQIFEAIASRNKGENQVSSEKPKTFSDKPRRIIDLRRLEED